MNTVAAVVTIVAAKSADPMHLASALINQTISKYGGKIVGPNGDTLIAVFGIEQSRGDPIDAVKAALALQRECRRLDSAGTPPRVGIITGEVTLRIDDGTLYEVEGDSVDLAVRLYEVARPGEILIDRATREMVESSFDLRQRNEVATKGKFQALEIFVVMDDPSSPASSELPPTPHGVRRVVVGGVESTRADFVVTGSGSSHNEEQSADEAQAMGDWVDCTVFAPPTVASAESFLVQVFAHLPEETERARELATEFDASAVARVFKSLASKVAHGTRLSFELVMPSLEIDDSFQSTIWRGRTESVQFGVTVPRDFEPCIIIGTVTVSENTVPVGHMKFKLEVVAATAARAPQEAEPVGDSARRYRTAFISYASRDRDEVIRRVQLLGPLGIRYFQDILDLGPGDRWEKELYRHIDECDLFLLFWSSAAKESTWVMEEVKYAVARKGNDDFAAPEIRPIIIEGPPVPLPPPELAHLHFNDRLVYFMANVDLGSS